MSGRCVADKAIDVVDEAGARVRLKAMTRPPDLKEIDEQIERLNQDKEEAVANQDFERAAALRDQADKLKKKKETITREWRERSKEVDGTVDEEVIAEVVSKMTGIPLTGWRPRRPPGCSGWRTTSRSGSSRRARPSSGSARPCAGAGPGSRIPSGRSAASSSPGPPGSARRCWPRPWPSSCSATPTR